VLAVGVAAHEVRGAATDAIGADQAFLDHRPPGWRGRSRRRG
jgi:hypothetical protein